MAKLKKYGTYALIAILSLGWLSTCVIKTKDKKQALKLQEDNHVALITDYQKKLDEKTNDTIFVGKVVESTTDDVIDSDLFSTFDSTRQAQIKKINEGKALLAALEANLEIISRKIEVLDYKLTNAVITDSSITFPKGDNIVFQDTVGDYQYKETITFGDSIGREFKSSLKLNPSFSFQRNRDKSIDGTVSFGNPEDTQLEMTNVISFYVPGTDRNIKHPKGHKIWMKVKPYAIGATWAGTMVLTGYAGFKTGVTISK